MEHYTTGSSVIMGKLINAKMLVVPISATYMIGLIYRESIKEIYRTGSNYVVRVIKNMIGSPKTYVETGIYCQRSGCRLIAEVVVYVKNVNA